MKAVFVMDMPERCSECNFSNPDGDWCPFHGEVSYQEYGSCKPDDCPLKQMPEKKKFREGMSIGELAGMSAWNACIDAITGENADGS